MRGKAKHSKEMEKRKVGRGVGAGGGAKIDTKMWPLAAFKLHHMATSRRSR